MITQQHAVNPILHGLDHIIRRLHPLEHDRHPVRRLSDPRQVLPRDGLVDVLRHQSAQPAPLLVLAALAAADGGPDLDGLGGALVGFPLPGHRGVDGDEDGLDAEGGGGAEDLDGLVVFAVDVELEEEGLGGGRGFDDGFEGVGGVTRDLRLLVEEDRQEWGEGVRIG